MERHGLTFPRNLRALYGYDDTIDLILTVHQMSYCSLYTDGSREVTSQFPPVKSCEDGKRN